MKRGFYIVMLLTSFATASQLRREKEWIAMGIAIILTVIFGSLSEREIRREAISDFIRDNV